MQQVSGNHGSTEGTGFIRVPRGKSVVHVEYRYHREGDGAFHGSVSTWSTEGDGAGLVAILSRALPNRAAVLAWIFAKAEKLTEAKDG